MFDWIGGAARSVGNAISSVGRGLFDGAKGVMSTGVNYASDFGGGAFAAIDERGKGASILPPRQTSVASRVGGAVGNIFGDIAESYIKNQVPRPGLPTVDQWVSAQPSDPGAWNPYRNRKPKARATNVPTAASGAGPFQALLGQLQPPQYAGMSPVPATRPGMSLVEPSADSPLAEWLVDQAVGLIPRDIREGLMSVGSYLGMEGQSMAGAVQALPGGAPVSPAVIPTASGPLSGRIYNVTQNLYTGAITVRAKNKIRYMNPATGEVDIYMKARPKYLCVNGIIVEGKKRCRKR